MFRWCFVFGVIGLIWQVSGDNKYENYTLMRIFPQTEEKVQEVVDFADPMGEVEMLKGSRGVNDSMDVLVPERRMEFMKEFVAADNITYEKKENYGQNFEAMDDRVPRRRYMTSKLNQFEYYSDKTIQDYLKTVAQAHPNLVTLSNRGRSYEGRQITLAKISSDPSAGNPIIFVDAGIHAREWVAPTMAVYLIHRLTTDPEAKQLLDGVDWHILPLVNPDGYEFSRSSPRNRLWRKTRSKNYICFGVDGNRNYGFKWGVSGVSKNACDKETYAGPVPFSEPETRIVRDIMKENAQRIKLYVSLHAYGNYLVYPWGYTGDFLPPTWKNLHSLAKRVSDAVQRSGGKPFKVLSAGKWYAAAGGSDDYAFGEIGVPYSYTMELTDGHEFVFPKSLLKTVLPPFYEGFKAFGAHIKSEFGKR